MSQDELLIIVDEKDNELDYLPRKIVHAKKLLHRTISIVMFNSKGQIILQRRSKNQDTYPKMYTNASGGHVLKGQNYDSCAKQEINEELGLSITPQLVKKLIVEDPNHRTVTSVYKVVYDGNFKINKDEIDYVKAFNVSELKTIVDEISPPAKFILKELGIL